MRQLSFSAIDTYHKCQRRFYHEYLSGEERPPASPQMLPGLVHHSALNRAIRRAMDGRPRDFVDDTTRAVGEFMPHLIKTGIKIDDLYFEVTTSLEKVFELMPFEKHAAAIRGTEHRFEWAGLQGVVDLEVHATFERDGKQTRVLLGHGCPAVIDFKVTTGRPRSARDAMFSPQLAVYALATGADRAAFLEIPRDVEKPLRVVSVEYTKADLETWQEWWAHQVESVTARVGMFHSILEGPRVWTKTLRSNPLCSPIWCPHWDKCYSK